MFNQVAQAKYDILVTGERALVSLSGAAKEAYMRFCYTISKGPSHVEPRTLPPTSAAALYHNRECTGKENVTV